MDRRGALDSGGLRLVRLADGDDLAVAGLESEAVPPCTVLVDFKFSSHVSAFQVSVDWIPGTLRFQGPALTRICLGFHRSVLEIRRDSAAAESY